MKTVMKSMGALALLGALVVSTGCVVRTSVPGIHVGTVVPLPGVQVTANYSPLYYEGYVVYYDGGGLPYYYLGGVPYYIPKTYHGYGVYVRHYNTYRPHYRAWHKRYGGRYYAYRRPGVTTAFRPGRAVPHRRYGARARVR